MSPIIRGIGTAVPPHVMTQPAALAMFQDLTCVDQRQRRLAKVLFEKAAVEQRHTFVPHQSAYRWCSPDPVPTDQCDISYLSTAPEPIPALQPGASPGLTTGQRSKLYAHYAGKLAADSAGKAIQDSGVSPASVTHLVTVSCTGFASPGPDIHLVKTLGLPATIQRTNVGFMGCHGSINGMRVALNIVKADPAAVVLMTSVELCSLHCRFQWDSEKIVGNALFGDGSASLVFTGDAVDSASPAKGETCWQPIATGSVLIPDSEPALSWHVGDHGFEMVLTSDIGDHIRASLHRWLVEWLAEQGIDFERITCWGVHPGGPRILSAVQSSLGLTAEQLLTSTGVLREFGNMSSPTVLFILERFRRQIARQSTGPHGPDTDQRPTNYCVLIAFGPGMMAEVALLKCRG